MPHHRAAFEVANRLRGVGVSGRGDEVRGAALASYLLFESPYTRELMKLGRNDTFARREEVMAFFGWCPRHAAAPIPAMLDTDAMPL